MTDCQLLHEPVLGLTLICPAQVTFGEVGSEMSDPIGLVLAHSRGLAWPPPPLLLGFFIRWWWWRLFGSECLAGLQMGFGISVRWAREGKHTNRSVEGAALASLPFMALLISFRLVFVLKALGRVWMVFKRKEGERA